MVRRAALLVNAKSRRGSEWFGKIHKALTEGGIELTESKLFRKPKQLAMAVQAQVAGGAHLVIVGGGDGTFSSVAQFFARKEAVLGVLPLGTGNAFARDLGIPADVDGACKTILEGKIAEVDMGLIADREFVNVASVGLTTRIALGLQDSQKKALGRVVYLASLVKALATIRPFRVSLELPNGKHEFDSLQVVIGNGRFHAGPFPVAPDATITGGWLSIYALASRRKIAFLKMALHMRGGKHVELDEVRSFRVQSGRLSTSPGQRVTVDGETCLETSVDFGMVPHALRVMAPPDFDEGN